MPEIKNQFTGGKMNKDLDERLIPKGEYRDAMNIQVSTSEGSSVGTVQNILGNTLGCTNYAGDPDSNPIPSNAFAVGSVSDEKDDSLYWLISGDGYSVDNIVDSNTGIWSSGETVNMRDLIIKKGADKCETVFVDQFAFSQPYGDSQVNSDTLGGIDLSVINQIQPGWTVTGVTDDGYTSNTSTIISLGNTQENFIGVEFGFDTVSTSVTTDSYVGYSQHAVASSVLIPFFPNFAGSSNSTYSQQNSNFVYISGFNGTPSALINDSIQILPNHSNPQTFTITDAEFFNITYSSGLGLTVVKLTLDSNLTTFTGPPIDQPSGVSETSSPPYSSGINGNVVDAIITSTSMAGINIATGELIIDINILDVSTLTGAPNGDTVYYNNIAYSVQSTNVGNNSIYLEDSNEDLLEGWQVGGSIYGVPQPTGSVIVLQSEIQVQLDSSIDLTGPAYTSLLYRGPRTLNFNHNNYITGINIVDDMLFWTDGKTEPKKINIPRSIQGSKVIGTTPGFAHTRLINEHQDIYQWNDVLVREEHITVIKKAPLSAPSINIETTDRVGAVSGSTVLFTRDFSGKSVGDTTTINASNNTYGFEPGDIIRLFDDINNTLRYDLRVQVILINNLVYTVKILSISPEADFVTTDWYADLEPIGSFLFERKLPRFAYRYKYLDNEYSSFSPFTNVAFYPGQFSYEPVKAYNKGMTNTIESLAIMDFVTPNMPKDVISIDLLYKNETSPIIYLIDTVSNKDELISGKNSWNSTGSHNYPNSSMGSYDIKNENIAQALPSNQSLRSWDNVPKKALAQEVSGNRVIYGNYVQGYDIKNNNGKNITPDINLSVKSNTISTGGNKASKSIKSLRNYEVGVVWGDKYGRETPVIASKSGSVLVPKNKSKTSNHLNVSLNSSPRWSDYYRFYVKETSNEYYNLAVDRVYDASDGGIWVSFPSVDRNKVDEDTYIILKKGVDSEEIVDQEGRYKIVAIDSEAPDYIKTSYDLIVRSNQDESRHPHSCNMWGGLTDDDDGCTVHPDNSNYTDPALNAPIVGRKRFSLNKPRWADDYDVSSRSMGLADLITLFSEVTTNTERTNNEMYVSFTKETEDGGETITQSGDKYHVIDIVLNDDEDRYIIHLEKPIGLNDAFVTEDTNDSTSGISLAHDNKHVIFWQQSVANKPEFDGRFFVKILGDQATERHLSRSKSIFNSWRTIDLDIYKIEDTGLSSNTDNDYDWSGNSIGNTPATTFFPSNSVWGSLNEPSEWQGALKFGTSTLKAAWFIDNAPFAGIYSNNGGGITAFQTEFIAPDGLTYNSCDRVSTLPGYNYLSNSANYTFSTMIDFSNQNGVSGAFPSGEDVIVGTGISLGRVGMKGVHAKNGDNYIDLSYSILSPDEDFLSGDGSSAWDVGNPSTNTSTDDQEYIVSKLTDGTRFKLKNASAIYKILGVQKFRVLNYMGEPSIALGTLAPGSYNPQYISYTQEAFDAGGQIIGSNSGTFENTDLTGQLEEIAKPSNKRATYRIKYELDIVSSPTGTGGSTNLLNENVTGSNTAFAVNASTSTEFNTIQFLEEVDFEGENTISSNPAIFETEPKEDVGLDLYYEASSSLPVFPLTNKNKFLFIPIGTTIVPPVEGFPEGVFISSWDNITPSSDLYINLSMPIDSVQYNALYANDGHVEFLRDDGTYVTATVPNVSAFAFPTNKIKITPNNEFGLNWHNCWSFNNGVESNRIGDTYNKPYLGNGVTLSTTVKDSPGQEARSYGLIYSGIYNSNSGVNSLNQFIAAEKITKDINPTYGSIQKLYAGWGQGGDLVAFCEDRVLKILANKDALYNADGNSNVTSTNNVLGQTIPYSGEYGISKNPESFASEAYRAYFTDKVRGSVMRLSMDGLTPISAHGMKNWFRDNLKLSNKLVGSYDARKFEYNLTLKGSSKTVSFKEDVKGWVSFKSFTPENAISCANEYYTFNNGLLWKHHDETEDRNTFYKDYPSDGFTPSSINVIINDQPGTIKTFHTLNYEGSQSKVDSFTNYDTYLPGTSIVNENVLDNDYYNISSKPGWKVQHIQTDLEQGSLNEFIKKEGKWFNYIKGKAGSVVDPTDPTIISSGFDNADFSFQGIGVVSSAPEISNVLGCTANGLDLNASGIVNDFFGDGLAALNYSAMAIVDDGSCIQTIPGCTATDGFGYDPLANVDDGSCVYYGCDDIYAPNYDPNAGFPVTPPGAYIFTNDGSCVAPIYGCMWPETDIHGNSIMSNYDSLANTPCNPIYISNGSQPDATPPFTGGTNGDNGCCVPLVYGCMISTADNFDPLANIQAVSSIDSTNPCFTTILGCIDPSACNWNDNANTDDESCAYCSEPAANNWDGVDDDGNSYGCVDSTGCLFCKDVLNLINYGGNPNTDDTFVLAWDETWFGNAQVAFYEIRYSNDNGNTYNYISNIPPNTTQSQVVQTISGLTPNTSYTVEVKAVCATGTSVLNPTYNTESEWSAIFNFNTTGPIINGCADQFACNFNQFAQGCGGGNNTGCCEYSSCTGCTDPIATNTDYYVDFNGNTVIAINDDGSCIYVMGCTDPLALNYDAAATADDGSCVLPLIGCLDDSLNNSDSDYAATNYAGPNTANISSYTTPSTPANTACVNNSCCNYIMPTLYAAPVDPSWNWGHSALLGVNGWRSSTLWGVPGQNERRKLWSVWDVSLSPKVVLDPALSTTTNFAYENENLSSMTTLVGDITNFNVPTKIQFKGVGNNSIQTAQIFNPTTGGLQSLELLMFEFSADSGLVKFGQYPFWYPPLNGAGAHQQAVKFEFYDSNIPAYTTPVEAYNVYLGCNDPNASNYTTEIPFFNNDNCVY